MALATGRLKAELGLLVKPQGLIGRGEVLYHPLDALALYGMGQVALDRSWEVGVGVKIDF
jgi:hypothetical protein